ncbi:MAG: ABC transporter ATP-binding protein [Clostridia bacterium]|nr:ABC transporter ATP-binding protein [Clostridia bacterium]
MKVVLKNLTKKFPSKGKKGKDVIAVDNFDFEIPDGCLVGLLGPSGCGKSTTLNLICGLIKPTDGQIYFGEDEVTSLEPEKRGVGMVFQNYALYPHLTVRGNIMFPLENLKGKERLTKEEMNEKVIMAAALVQIENLLDRKPGELSGGQQQRVAIARALVKLPRVLLLDEPLSNLDARLRLQTREEIKRIQKKTKITTIFVTHDQEEAMSISDLIVVMKDGVIQQIDKPQRVYQNPKNLFVAKFLGTPPVNVFNGKIANGGLYIGNERIMDTDKADGEVYVAIRPEGFVIASDGVLTCDMDEIEVMGRDITVIAKHKDCENEDIRAIVSSETEIDETGDKIKFNLKKEKVFVFDKKTEERVL